MAKLKRRKKEVQGNRGFSICIIGAGYVGLVAAACFSKLGNKVVCVDNNKRKIDKLKKLSIPNYEPGLDALVIEAAKKKRLSFSASIPAGVKAAQIIFIAVGTPSREGGEADLTSIENVAQTIAKNLKSYKLIVEKSTVPVQTGMRMKETIRRYTVNVANFEVASNPEFLREGKAVKDFLEPDRIVIGVESRRAEKILKALYKPIKAPMLVTDINTAELIKHASNSFLATKISFINAVSLICEKTGANIEKVSLGMGMDKRIGCHFLDAGIGFGGSCFPKDVSAFIEIARKNGVDFKLLKEVHEINDRQRLHFTEKIKEELWILKDKTIGILGVSFKPDTDDLRDAPALDIIRNLLNEGARVKVYDPKAMPKAKKAVKGVSFCKNAYQAVVNADCLALLTEWQEFSELDFGKIKNKMQYPFIIDGRNFLDFTRLKKLGFKCVGMGK